MLPKRGFVRVSIIGVIVLVLALVGVHAYNFALLDPGAWRAGAEPLLARARAISERARPEYQDLALATLPPNPHNGPFYRLDDRLHEAEIVERPAAVAEADGAVLYAFDFDDADSPGLIAADGQDAPLVEDGMLKMLGLKGRDHLTNADPIAIPQDDIGDIVIRARASQNTSMRLAWSKDEQPASMWQNRVDIDLLGDGEFHSYVINGRNVLKRGLAAGDELARLFLRPADTWWTDVEIDFIRFLSKQSRYLAAPNGVLYDTLGGEMRKVLYMLPEQTLEWVIDVPQNDPRFEFGNGILLDDRPVRFEVSVGVGDETVLLHDRTLSSASGWRDFRLDLSAWAGKSVRLQLRVSGDARSVALWSNPFLHSRPQKRFNVIVVLEDALRADYLSAQGYELDTSPNKVALMKQGGIQFDWAVSQATKTRPSVPSLMTSLYPTATGVWHFSDILSERYLTLAEILRAQGFATASFLQNGNAGAYAGLHQGFSELYDEQIMGQATEDIYGGRVFSWLEQHRDRNFFLYLHAIDPHGPYEPPPPFDTWYREVAGQGSSVARDQEFEPESIREPTAEGRRRRYAGEIRHNDALFPRLLEKLRSLDLTEDTLLILLADHGEYMGEHGWWGHQPPGLMPVIHVPLMMIYPKRFQEAKRIGDPVQLIDVVPTILELAEVDPAGLLLQGDSLVGLVEGREPARWRDRVVISEEPTIMHKQGPCRCASVVRRDWHVISSTSAHLWLVRGGRFLPGLIPFVNTRVYQFRDDPTEQSALLSAVPDLYVRWLAYDVISELQDTNMTTQRRLTEGESVDLQLDPDTLEHLRGLGYVN
ncbi:MAG: sulfatase-like hydrolase/transferase [Geminicoccaceae bacterium]